MIVRFVRRPAFPGETNHELVWPLVFIFSCIIGFIFFQWGGTSPGCLFYRITSIPCLGCGATRCARELSHFNFLSAFKYHPGLVWTLYSIGFWISGSTLRLRIIFDESAHKLIFAIVFIVAFIHWVWQCYYLR